MRGLVGKRIRLWLSGLAEAMEGVCVAETDDELRILCDGETDDRVVLMPHVVSYSVVGAGSDGPYSGLKAYVCMNSSINCDGRVCISARECNISDMGCEACAKGNRFGCDFGCVGAIEVMPPKVQRVLFDGMTVCRNRGRNYLKDAVEGIKGGGNK